MHLNWVALARSEPLLAALSLLPAEAGSKGDCCVRADVLGFRVVIELRQVAQRWEMCQNRQ